MHLKHSSATEKSDKLFISNGSLFLPPQNCRGQDVHAYETNDTKKKDWDNFRIGQHRTVAFEHLP